MTHLNAWTMPLDSPAVDTALLSSFRSRRILVVGDAILDEYVHGDCSRLSPEAPVPVLKVGKTKRTLGGAANTAANIASLGGSVALIAPVGSDEAGAALAVCAAEAGVELYAIHHSGPTVRKTRVIGQQQQIVRLDYEVAWTPDRVVQRATIDLVEQHVAYCDLVVLSDYAKGFVSPSTAEALIAAAKSAGRLVVVDPRPQHRDRYAGCDYITPNWKEALALLNWPDQEPLQDAVQAVAQALAEQMATHVVLTLGAHGIHFRSRDGREEFSVPTFAQEVFDVSGAGDTVAAALALSLSVGAGHATAVRLANAAASVVVGKFGTATVSASEIAPQESASRLVEPDSLAALAAEFRATGKRPVAVFGDIEAITPTLVHALEDARRHGDLLVVGLLSTPGSADAPARASAHESLDRLGELARMILALRVVDYVCCLGQMIPEHFISTLEPVAHFQHNASTWAGYRSGQRT